MSVVYDLASDNIAYIWGNDWRKFWILLRRNLKIQLLLLATSYGVPDLPDFWATPESAMPDQVTETEGADRRTLPLFATGRRSKALRLWL